MIISNKYLIHLFYNDFYRHCSPIPYQSMHLFTFLRKFLPAGFPRHPEFTIPAMGTVMCKTQKCKNSRVLSFSFTSLFRKTSKFNEIAFAFLQGHSKVFHPTFQVFIEFFLILEARHKIIYVNDQSPISFHLWLYAFFKPL